MQAKDFMHREVRTVRDEDAVGSVIELFDREHIHGAPVVDSSGALVGVVTQQDIFFSSMTLGSSGPSTSDVLMNPGLKVRDIMTAPAVSATEQTDIRGLCRMMCRLRIHRVPIVDKGKVTGIVSSLDICRVVSHGELHD